MLNIRRFMRNHIGPLATATAGTAAVVGALVVLPPGSAAPMSASASPPSTTAPVPPTSAAGGAKHTGARHAGKDKGAKHAGKAADPARVAWAHRYGESRTTMAVLAPAGDASAEEQTAASDLLVKTEAATAQYADPAAAKAAGYDLQADLASHAKHKGPKLANEMAKIDAGAPVTPATMPMLHVGNKALQADGKVLDPSAPETLMYGYQGQGSWMLMGVMYKANEAFPSSPPDPGGPITRWHYHDKKGPGEGLMMHVFFVQGGDLAHAYAADMKS